MKFNTTREYYFSADYYSYQSFTSADGTIVQKKYATTPVQIQLNMTTNLALGGATTYTGTDLGSVFITSPTKLQISGKIKNLRDSKGTLSYEGGGEWIVTMSAPRVGPRGIQDGYTYRLAQTAGNV